MGCEAYKGNSLTPEKEAPEWKRKWKELLENTLKSWEKDLGWTPFSAYKRGRT